jgi:hypothetical protein
MVPLPVVVRHELANRPEPPTFPEESQTVEALRADLPRPETTAGAALIWRHPKSL